ncbi:succinate dehydrogenase cytochrome b subunit [Desulfotalea psychrophila]|uniref:Succinate dehydrogenase n=1 Tax=Desulfotalea psychrophila (strain LSv54 / DSM 12343) TaxID=177439 RepID=Q6ALB1_DESPS|nr:succinate dehydrogenase cytochrome b subunit [Desulfotalea psychrophila]CAG36864.1 hypothetical protein DP2135 [Desulfotalea psychrophila LSv54]
MWFVKFVASSIGKKFVMAFTGLLLILFLCVHAAGNAIIFFGSEAFLTYAHALHAVPLVVVLFSSGLAVVLLAHICFGLYLFFENRTESDSRYAVSVRTVKYSLASKTMHWSGLFIFLFLIFHLAVFTFGGKDIPISTLVEERLGDFSFGIFYLISFAVLALHLSHGFWSMLQTFGVNHPRYNDLIHNLTYIVPLFFFVIFGGVTLYFLTGLGANF